MFHAVADRIANLDALKENCMMTGCKWYTVLSANELLPRMKQYDQSLRDGNNELRNQGNS